MRSLGQWLAARQIAVSMIGLVVWVEETAWRLRADDGYDLLNYHLYGPFALLHGRWGRDWAPAQLQGFFPPFNDLPYYLLARHIGRTHVLHLALGLIGFVPIAAAFGVALRWLRADTVALRLLALAVTVIGATGAASHTVLATSMSDALPCAAVVGSLFLLLGSPGGSAKPAAVAFAGALSGFALGMKLTVMPEVAALGLATLVRSGPIRRAGLGSAVVFGAAALVVLLLVAGPWWLFMWRMTGNPVFPLYNEVFRSPLAFPGSYVDVRFMPHGLLQAIAYPFLWAVNATPRVTEPDLPMRDPRIALALVAAVAAFWRPGGPYGRVAGVFVLGSVALWERQFAILRYLSPVEVVSGTIMALPFVEAVRRRSKGPIVLLGAAVVLLGGLRVWTVSPNWGRAAHEGGRTLDVAAPQIPPDSLVVILHDAPLGYLALFEPETVRFVGANNNLTQPAQGGLSQVRIREAIAKQTHDLFGVELLGWSPGRADATLQAYGLERASCRPVLGSLPWHETQLCALVRRFGTHDDAGRMGPGAVAPSNAAPETRPRKG